ncbi:hypothetical protein F0170_09730 [Pseudomonas sp. MAFF 730085]|uniref:Uncharacterized protein n=1 Tax=Pseudomonas kitaguniensis TaxID=2607908 RepID=A0A5N7JS77_9PSED|nr:hypothetical protein [Pseudomonas kitaguniensis]MPQ84237.1 hypothetical protein [Pseudomonas kitaguniensis]
MRKRGNVYWDWADQTLHTRSVDERQVDGTVLNVQVRMSLLGRTQLFIGVYGDKGAVISEEAFDSLPGETMTKALAWGLERARLQSPARTKSVKGRKTESLPRTGSKQAER